MPDIQPLKVKTKVEINAPGLTRADTILQEEYTKTSKTIGDYGVKLIRSIQRKASGEEQRRTKYRVVNRKGFSYVEFYNTIIQAAVDETGAKPHFPPYKEGSSLFFWVSRKGLSPRPTKTGRNVAARAGRVAARKSGLKGEDVTLAGRIAANKAAANLTKKIESISFLIARAISRRGLPRPGDPLRRPFETSKPKIELYSLRQQALATGRAVNRINGESK